MAQPSSAWYDEFYAETGCDLERMLSKIETAEERDELLFTCANLGWITFAKVVAYQQPQILYEPRVYSLISECSKPLVVELGAGTALCGNLLCKEFNAEAIVTDTTDVLASLNANISANWNHDLSRDHQEGKSMPVAMQCDWTNVSDVDAVINAIHARSECDQIFLIACDVLFSEHLVRALTSMIARVLHASSSQIRRRASSALVCSDRRCERAARAYDDASKQMFATQMPLPTWMADLSEHMVFDLLRLE